jgi:hypothetical protein
MTQGLQSWLENRKILVQTGLVQMKQVNQLRQAPKMRDLLDLMTLGLTMQEDLHWLVPKKQVVPSLLEIQKMREDLTVRRMLVGQQKQVLMMLGLQSLLENPKKLVLTGLE